MAPATVKLAVAFTSTPRNTASSIAARPAVVTGSLTCMLGASANSRSACATIAAASRDRRGSTCAERRPCRPRLASWTGARSVAPRAATSSTIRHAISVSAHVGCSAASSRARARQVVPSARTMPRTMGGFEVAPVAPFAMA